MGGPWDSTPQDFENIMSYLACLDCRIYHPFYIRGMFQKVLPNKNHACCALWYQHDAASTMWCLICYPCMQFWGKLMTVCLSLPTEQVRLTDVRYLVVDEADTMFDRSFRDATTSIIRTVKTSTTKNSLPAVAHSTTPCKGPQVIVVAATLSTQLMKTVETLVSVSEPLSTRTCTYTAHTICDGSTRQASDPWTMLLLLQNVKVVTTKSLHRILPHIEQCFYKVSQPEKAGKIADTHIHGQLSCLGG